MSNKVDMPKKQEKNKKVKKPVAPKGPTRPTTQKFLDITEIKEDCVALKNGALRAILLVSSVNFSLKSEEEQEATITAYRNFLNTLTEWSLQIVVQSRRIDIDKYVEDLKKREKEQTNELLKMQIAEYVQYIQELVEIGEITTKRFFIVVPYSPGGEEVKGFFKKLLGGASATGAVRAGRKQFEKDKEALFKRVTFVMAGLQSMGLKSTPLNTQSLIELFYNTYNPTIYSQEKMTDVGELRVEG